MDIADVLLDGFARIQGSVRRVMGGLDPEALLWRPDADANPIGWLVWHLTRIQDDHVSDLAAREQTWVTEGWATRFGLPTEAMDLGYGHTSEQVAAIRPDSAEALVAYHDQVAEQTRAYVEAVDGDELDRVIDTAWDPPVTVGVRLVSVLNDDMQHIGQAAYVRGLFERRGT